MPIVGVDTPMELATPTGVAVLVALAERFGRLPDMTVERVGYGAGPKPLLLLGLFLIGLGVIADFSR